MSVFLFLKQIVDVLYQFQWLDYLMVVFALGLCVVCFWKERNSFKRFIWLDGVVLGMALLSFVAFLQNIGEGYTYFFKCLSAYLIYFLGRFGWKKIIECETPLALCGYGILYANFIHRIVTQRGNLIKMVNEGELYYYKTDLAFGIITATIFIFFFGKRKVEKYVSVFVVTPIMILFSGARMQWFALAVFYVIAALSIYENKRGKPVRLGWKQILIFLGISAALFVGIIAILSNEAITTKLHFRTFNFSEGIITETNTHSRGEAWPLLVNFVNHSPLWQLLFGHEWNGEYALLSAANLNIHDSHNMYVKLLFSTGYVGLFLFLLFWVVVFVYLYGTKQRKIYYVSFAVFMLFLMSGISISAIVLTQMSWFAFLYAGVIVSERFEKTEENREIVKTDLEEHHENCH